MRCGEVIRELAVPSDEQDASALVEHLSHCQTCAAWAQNAAHLEKVWEASRPCEPSSSTWDAMWADITSSFDPAHSTTSLQTSGLFAQTAVLASVQRFDSGPLDVVHHRRVRVRSLVGVGLLISLAQAAAIIFAVGLSWHRPHMDEGAVPLNQAASLTAIVDIEEGQTVLIRSNGMKSAVIDLTPKQLLPGVDDFYVMFNALESMATNSNLAMRD